MKLACLLLALATFGLSFLDGGRTAEGGPEWLDDLDAAFGLAAETGRPLLIVFR